MLDLQYYEIQLENYSLPRYASSTKPYYGTIEDMFRLADHLAEMPGAQNRYKETVDAIRAYSQDNNVTHSMANKVLPVFTPAEFICNFDFLLTDHSWTVNNQNGTVYPCFASKIYVSQTLLRTETRYVRCAKVMIEGLKYRQQQHGWTLPNNLINGFPGIITYLEDHRAHVTSLLIAQKHYSLSEEADARADTVNADCFDLSKVIADIIGEG